MSQSTQPMKLTQRSGRWRVWHRWLSLFFGVQMVLWSISGAYMVFFELSFIHGDHLVRPVAQQLPVTAQPAPLNQVLKAFPRAREITLQSTLIHGSMVPTYKIFGHRTTQLINAQTLERLEFSQADITAISNVYYAATDTPKIRSVEYLESQAPSEISPSLLPVWQVNYDDFANTSFYISPRTGELLTKRHDFWRGFDFMWMLHIMDYETRENITSWLLRIFILGTGVLMVTGMVLLIFTLRQKPTKVAS